MTQKYNVDSNIGATTTSGDVKIKLTGENDAPVAINDTANITENQSINIASLNNDIDVDNGAVLSVDSASSTRGLTTTDGNTVTFSANTDFDYLAQGETTTETISYTAIDEHGATDTASIDTTITGVNDAPVANNDTAIIAENQSINIASLQY